MIEVIEAQVIALRQQAASMIATCDAILYALDAMKPKAEQAAAPVVGNLDPKLCGHPSRDRESCATMGDPGAWFCPHCRHTSTELAAGLDAPGEQPHADPNGGD